MRRITFLIMVTVLASLTWFWLHFRAVADDAEAGPPGAYLPHAYATPQAPPNTAAPYSVPGYAPPRLPQYATVFNPNTWQIHRSEVRGGDSDTLLLNTATGESWVLER